MKVVAESEDETAILPFSGGYPDLKMLHERRYIHEMLLPKPDVSWDIGSGVGCDKCDDSELSDIEKLWLYNLSSFSEQ